VSTTAELLRRELSAIFGPPRDYPEFWSWSLDSTHNLRAHVYAHCPSEASCQLWMMDQALPDPGPQLVAEIASPDQVQPVIARLRLLVEERKPRDEPPARTPTVRRHWARLRARRRHP
jgi:hypothetical protein